MGIAQTQSHKGSAKKNNKQLDRHKPVKHDGEKARRSQKNERGKRMNNQTEAQETKGYDLVSAIIQLETGEMMEEEIIELFQHLIDTGKIEGLQGSYGRTAQQLIEAGLCHA